MAPAGDSWLLRGGRSMTSSAAALSGVMQGFDCADSVGIFANGQMP
jgi:hypothetical protein